MNSTELLGSGQSFEGVLFEGNPKDKTWTPICEGTVTMTITTPGGGARGGVWNMVASQKEEKVWESGIGPGLKHRVKDNFIQWQRKTGEGTPMTFGLRLKTAELAEQLHSTLAAAVSSVACAVKHGKMASSVSDSVVLKIVPPNGDSFSLPLPPTTTIAQVMAVVAERRKLNPAHYNLTLPAEDPKGDGVACFGSMSVSRLKTHTLYLRRQVGAPEETRSDKVLVQVELPRGERTTVKASTVTSLPELLQMVCKKRNLDMEDFQFDLPATEDSLSGKTLGQLKLNTFRLIPRDTMSEVKGRESPKGAARRHAPPPPPQGLKVSAKLMKELSAEVSERLRDREQGGTDRNTTSRRSPIPAASVTTPTTTPLTQEVDRKPLPPPVASKPKKKPVEEVDMGGDSPSIPRIELDSMVMGVKVRETAERPEIGSITEGLKLTAASGGRYMSVKKMKQQSMEENAIHLRPRSNTTRLRERHKSREMEDLDVFSHPAASLTKRDTRSLRRRPKGPAPAPPRGSPVRAATLGRRTGARDKKTDNSTGYTTRRPVRKAPPAPVKVPMRPKITHSATPPNEATPKSVPSSEETIPVTMEIHQQRETEEAMQQKEEVDFSGYEFHPLTPPKSQSPLPSISTPPPPHHSTPPSHHSTPPTPHSTPPPEHSTSDSPQPDVSRPSTHVEEKEGGGKRLIVKPSPGSTRKISIIFDLPPPPPPQFTGTEEKGREEARENGHTLDGIPSEPCMPAPLPAATTPTPAPSNHTSEHSILSNEYTNLDDESDNEATTDFTNMDGSPACKDEQQFAAGQNGSGATLEHVTITAIEELSYETSLQEVTEQPAGLGDISVMGHDMTGGVEGGEALTDCRNGSTDKGKIILPPPLEDYVNIALNCNGNNNNGGASMFPPPPLEFVAPSEKFSTPAPLEGFEMPPEPSFDEGDSELAVQDEDREREKAVVLVAMTSHSSHAVIEVGGVKNEVQSDSGDRGEKVMRGCESSASVKSLGTQLSELDSMVTSMQEMVAESSLSPLPSPPPSLPLSPPPSLPHSPPPSPPPLLPLPTTNSPIVSLSPVPPKPPPPVLLPTKKRPTQASSDPTQPSSAPDHVHAELKEKLAARHELLKSQPSHHPSPDDPVLVTPVHQQQSVDKSASPQPGLIPASLPTDQRPPGMMATSAGDVQFQLQFLQQQFLQQQMMQLQQQFSQLQHSIHHQPQPAAMAMLPTSSLYPQHMHPHPGVVAMPTATLNSIAMPMHPVMGPSVGMPTAGMVAMASPINMLGQPPQVSTASPHLMGIPSSSPPRPPPLTSTPTSHSQEVPHLAKQQSSSDVRSGALGELASQFDRLMEDVRETDRTELLKKLTPEKMADEGGSYSGMAAVLAEALKERRKHFADKHNRTMSETEDSRLSEWDT